MFHRAMKALKFTVIAAAAISLPAMCLAIGNGSGDTGPPGASGGSIGLGPIIAVLTALVAVAGAVMDFVPKGWRTYANLAAAALPIVISALTELSASGAAVSKGAILMALVGAVIGRAKAGKS